MELQNLFTAVLNMTVTGSIVIGCVLLARLVLGRAPKVFSCALWLVVLFRLLCPVSVSGPVSVLELVDAPETEGAVGVVEYVPMPEAPSDAVVMQPGQTGSPGQLVTVPVPETPRWQSYGALVWSLGAGGLLAYGVINYVNLKRKMRASMALGRGIRESDRIDTPFVLGFFKPVIYLPVELEERAHILLHEQCHVRWGDPLVKGLFYLACCLHWFNPLVWLAFVLCGRDMELRCDETVLKQLGPQVRSDYAQSLLNLAAGRRMAPAPLAFGEGDTGKRIRYILGWKRKAAWMAIPAAALCALVLVLTGCNPAAKESPFGHSYQAVSSYASVSDFSFPINTYYTLTSDMALFIRGEKTEQVGFFQKVPANDDSLKDFSESFRRMIRRSWHIEGSGWWLIEIKSGDLQLHNLNQQVTHTLARTDLLGVSIRQPGMEAYVEPVWYSTDTWNWMPEEMSTTLVDSDAQIVLMPELDVDRIQVSEEYYERTGDGSVIIDSDYLLEPDKNGDFLLNVSRRGKDGDDFAIYRVTVGEDHYVFRLAFPAIPGETSVSISAPEQTREVRFSHGSAYITLQIPESWDYTVISPDDEAIDAGITGGISFWPLGREEGKVFFGYYPDRFAVCGTGLETAAMTLAGQTATVGTYDDHALWDYISFGEYFAVWGQGHEAWWAEYGDIAMEILDSAQFGA